MGFLSSWFGNHDPFEQQLVQTHVAMFQAMGLSKEQATEMIRGMIMKAKKEAADEGTVDVPNAGDRLLERAHIDASVRQQLDQLRAEGVTDQDIRWWWNLRDLERRMMLHVDNWQRLANYIDGRQKGTGREGAMAEVRRFHPIFGDPLDTANATGDDRPLPVELKNRVTSYILSQGESDPVGYKQRLDRATSFNALVRQEMRDGRL